LLGKYQFINYTYNYDNNININLLKEKEKVNGNRYNIQTKLEKKIKSEQMKIEENTLKTL
jgi:hypothetical protein